MTIDIVCLLAKEWRDAGVANGDTIMLHSSISRTLRRIARMGGALKPELIIESFLESVGVNGTLLFPLFNFNFTSGIPFDIRTSPSQMGALTETARLWPGVVRTGHPIYSFAILGNKANLFRGLKNFSGYGDDSPFGLLHRLEGKIGIIDLPDQSSMTFYHYVEEALNAPYRYHKTFTGQYIDELGIESTESYGLFVRDLEAGVQTHVDPMGEVLWAKGIYSGYRPNEGCGLRVVHAAELFDEVAKVLTEGRAKGLLYEIK